MKYLYVIISICLLSCSSKSKNADVAPMVEDKEAALMGRWHTTMNISKDVLTGEVVIDADGYDTTMSLNFQAEEFPGGPAGAKKMYCYFDPMQRTRTTYWLYDKANSVVYMKDVPYTVVLLMGNKLVLNATTPYYTTNYYFER